MGLFDSFSHEEAENSYQNVYYQQQHHEGSLTHEAIAGAAGFAAMKAYEDHLRATGEQPSHPLMKEILAGIASAEVDKLVETKGLDWMDRRRAKEMAVKQAHQLAEQRYNGGTGWEYAAQAPGPAVQYEYGRPTPYGMDQGYGRDVGRGYDGYGGSRYEGGGSGGYGGGYPQEGYGGYAPPPPGPPPQGYEGYGEPASGYAPGYGPPQGRPEYGGYGAPPPPQGGYGGGYGGGW